MAKPKRLLPADQPLPLPGGKKVQLIAPLSDAKALAHGVPAHVTLASTIDPLADTKSGITLAAYAQLRAGITPVEEVTDPKDEQLLVQAAQIGIQAAQIAALQEQIAALQAKSAPAIRKRSKDDGK